jgi:hypothetical protein
LSRLVPDFSHFQKERAIGRPSDSRPPAFVGESVLTGAEVDYVGVGERIAGAGVDYRDEDGRGLSATRRFASCERKTGKGKRGRESQELGVTHQGTGGLPLFQRIVARIMANISPKIIPILMGPPWRASSFK